MPDYYLLYNDATSVTGRELGQWLKDHGLDIDFGETPGDTRYQGLVRWGSTARVERKPHKVLNWQLAISLAAQKRDSLMRMQADGIRIPTIYGPQSQDMQFPVMGRATHHVGGTDIVPCWQQNDIALAVAKGCTYFTGYIPCARELRIHVFGEKIIKISEKVLTEPTLWQPHIRNLSTGYTFRVPTERPKASTRYAAIAAAEAHGLHFCAADVVEGDDEHAYVLEVNTAPGLTTDSSLEAYGNCILEEFA